MAAVIRDDRERYVAAATRALQAQDVAAISQHDIGIVLEEIADALARQDSAGLERWAARQAQTVSAESVGTLVHGVVFAVASSVEDDPELFDVALIRLDFLERRASEIAAAHAKPFAMPAATRPAVERSRRRSGA